MYVLVRTDIPLADQIVQVGHVCLEAGFAFARPQPPCHLVLFGVTSERQLLTAAAQIEAEGIRCVVFHEPDDGMGYTTACTEPIANIKKGYFRRFSLWRVRKGVDAR